MKSAGWYFMKGGQKVWAATVTEIKRLAQLAADEVGKPVTVRRAARSKPAAMKRNPLGLGGMGAPPQAQWQAEERARRARLDYLAATKARRLAKSLRTRAPAAKEASRAKTGKFRITAANRKERFTLFRPTRSQANQLAREFEAAGYDVAVQEV